MDVYVDSSALCKTRPIEDCIRDLSRTCEITRILHHRARCKKLLWIVNSESYDHKELCRRIYEMAREVRDNPNSYFAKLSTQEQRIIRGLATELAASFIKKELRGGCAGFGISFCGFGMADYSRIRRDDL